MLVKQAGAVLIHKSQTHKRFTVFLFFFQSLHKTMKFKGNICGSVILRGTELEQRNRFSSHFQDKDFPTIELIKCSFFLRLGSHRGIDDCVTSIPRYEMRTGWARSSEAPPISKDIVSMPAVPVASLVLIPDERRLFFHTWTTSQEELGRHEDATQQCSC